MIVAVQRTQLRDHLRRLRGTGRTVALVPTMGALHAGHLALVRAAAAGGHAVAVSIFVNPRQFDEEADYARYPVDHALDLGLLSEVGVDLVWTPAREDVYAGDHATSVTVGGPALGFEGAVRPGHFDGVATVVSILLGAVGPDEAWFGEKDWQQLQVIRRLVADLAMPVAIRALPTVREPDGLAMSSRNRFLDAGARIAAPRLFATLKAVAASIANGTQVARALGQGDASLRADGFAVDYLDLVHGASLDRIDRGVAGARILAAARLGSVRLLDNIAVD